MRAHTDAFVDIMREDRGFTGKWCVSRVGNICPHLSHTNTY